MKTKDAMFDGLDTKLGNSGSEQNERNPIPENKIKEARSLLWDLAEGVEPSICRLR